MQYEVFGPALKAYREDHNLSQQELATILGTSKQVISRYETGQREPKIGLAKEYAQKLGLPLTYFLGEDYEETATPITENTLSDFELSVIKRLRQLPEEQQRAFLLILTGSNTQEP